MESADSNKIAPSPVVEEPPHASIGGTLREARERLGMSVEEVANQVKFAPRQVQALEADDFSHLPEIAFVRGFVRSYAKVLNLDANLLLSLLPDHKSVAEKIEPASVEAPFSEALTLRQHNMLWLGGALLVALIATGFALWQSAPPDENPTPVAETLPVATVTSGSAVESPLNLPAQIEVMSTSAVDYVDVSGVESASPVVGSGSDTMKLDTQLAASAVMPATNHLAGTSGVLRLVFDEESWTEIRDREGKLLSSQVNLGGSELQVDGVSPFAIVIGHASKVHLYRGGKLLNIASYINLNSDVARLTVE